METLLIGIIILVVCILLGFSGFMLGIQYQKREQLLQEIMESRKIGDNFAHPTTPGLTPTTISDPLDESVYADNFTVVKPAKSSVMKMPTAEESRKRRERENLAKFERAQQDRKMSKNGGSFVV